MDLEFVDEPSERSDGAGDDVVPGRTGRVPPWFVGLLVVAVAAIAVIVVVAQHPDHTHPVATPSQHAAPHLDQTLLAVYDSTHDLSPAHDVVRGESGGTCRSVRIGSSPQHAASIALQQKLPGYRVIDTSRIIDQLAGLCGLQVRARDAAGNVAVINVTSPSPGPTLGRIQLLQAHSGSIKHTAVEYAEFTTRSGWVVVVGTSGPKARQPSTTELGELAASPALRW